MQNFVFKYAKWKFSALILMTLIGWLQRTKVVIITAVVLLLFLIYFFRVPKPRALQHSDHIYTVLSPAYGRILNITRSDKTLKISIFLSVFDPHIQYVPINGAIEAVVYKKGQFNPAFLFDKGEANERMTTIIQTIWGVVIVEQIAGVLARSIHNYLNPKQKVIQGGSLGFIEFGSRVDMTVNIEHPTHKLIMPQKLKRGDTVVALEQICNVVARK